MNKEKLKMDKDGIVGIIAEGLDAAVDGKGWNLKHQKALALANASPKLLAALKGMMKLYMASSNHPLPQWTAAHAAIAAAEPYK